jgi:hypothetical protein
MTNKKEYKIINNFLKTEDFLKIKNFLFSQLCPWYFKDSMTHKDSYFFFHCFYNHFAPQSSVFEELIQPIVKLLHCNSIIEIRANLMLKKEKQYSSNFHIDRGFSCKTAILYLNTCNGYTLLDNKEKLKIKCEENKILIFDSHVRHAAVSQTDTEKRIVINFNYF